MKHGLIGETKFVHKQCFIEWMKVNKHAMMYEMIIGFFFFCYFVVKLDF